MKTLVKFFLPLCLLLGISQDALAQTRGNAAYEYSRRSYPYPDRNDAGIAWKSDSTFIINARLLMNTTADLFMAVFALSEAGDDARACNEAMDRKIARFIEQLSGLGVGKEDISGYLVSQTPVYDYRLRENVAEQFLAGFELNRNVVVRFREIGRLEPILLAAAGLGIYDIVKVDYVVESTDAIFDQMYQAATAVIQAKRDRYIALTGTAVLPESQIHREVFYSILPGESYQSYTAYESSGIRSSYDSDVVRREERKKTTFYYDRPAYSGFDKVLNPGQVEVGPVFVLELSVLFQIQLP